MHALCVVRSFRFLHNSTATRTMLERRDLWRAAKLDPWTKRGCVQIFRGSFVNIGARKGGLCFQWAGELLSRLDALRLQTLDLHWAESYAGTSAEHNVIVVTARGQPFERGILLDNWRYGGHLVYGRVAMDPEYRWTENPAELARRLKANSTPTTESGPATGETKRLMRR